MYNIFCLSSDLRLTQILINLERLLIQKDLEHRSKIKVAAVDCEGPNLSLKGIIQKLDDVKKAEKKWTFQNILKRLKDTCFSPERERSVNVGQAAEKIAAHFQVRANNFILKNVLHKSTLLTIRYLD